MDALYQRYARPMELLDTLIVSGRLREFVRSMWSKKQDDALFEVWLHKVRSDMGFKDFKRRVLVPASRKMTHRQIEATVQESFAILNGFQPPEGVS